VIATARIDLRGRPTWDTAMLTVEAFHWPTDAPNVALKDLVAPLTTAGSIVEAGVQVVTPTGLDEASGGIRRRSQRYQGSVFQVTRDLQINDLLVAPSPEAPVLLVTEHLQGALVSSRFTALRTTGAVTPLWIWAVLNSMSGRDLRQRLSLGGFDTGTKTRILDLGVPVPPLARQREAEPTLRSIEYTTHIEEEEAPSTWWRIADLRRNEWQLQLATANPERLDDGPPLETYADKIQQGRVLHVQVTNLPNTGMPIIDGAALAGRPISRWLKGSGESSVIAESGDVLVAAIGTRARATVVTGLAAVDRSAILIRLKNRRHAEAVAHYLNGSAGYAFRQMFLRGSTIPHLSVANLARIPIPADVLADSDTIEPTIPLALRLENALWRT
jgi:hypothetical protein